MKLKTIFKKAKGTKQPIKQQLDKKQLEKVIGGAETTTGDRKSGSIILHDYNG